MDSKPARRSFPAVFIGLLVLVLVIAAAAGAYLDWIWWHPTQGIVVTLAAMGLLLAAGVTRLLRRRLATMASLVLVVAGAGLLAGQLFGPSRPQLSIGEGRMTIRLDSPVAGESSGEAFCQWEPDGSQLQVSGDSNMRLALSGVEPIERPFLNATVYRGDRWSRGPQEGDDSWTLSLIGGAAVEVGDGGSTELWLESGAGSELSADTGAMNLSGTLAFSDLDVTNGDVAAVLGATGEVAGRVEWSCDVP